MKWTSFKRKTFSTITAVALVFAVFNSLPRSSAKAESETVSLVDPLVYNFNILNDSEDGVYMALATEGWTVFNATPDIRNGNLKITANKANVELQGEDNLGLNTTLYKAMKIRLQNASSATQMKISFITDRDIKWTDDKSVTIPLVSSDAIFREYVVDAATVFSGWKDQIRQVKIVFNNQEGAGKINIDRIGYYPDATPSDTVFDFSLGNQGINHVVNGNASFTSTLNLKASAAGMGFCTADLLKLDASGLGYVQLNLQNASSAGSMKIYFTTMSDQEWSEKKSISTGSLVKKDSGISTYTFNMRSVPEWKGRIKQLKIVFPDSTKDGDISITTMKVLGGLLVKDIKMDFSSGLNGWTAGTGAGVSSVDGAMRVETLAENANVVSPKISIDTRSYPYMKILLGNSTRSSAMRLEWLNEETGNWDDCRMQNVLIDPKSGVTEYIIPLSDNQYWSGTVSRIRILPALNTTTGYTDIKSIVFTQYADVTYMNRDIKEGFLDRSSVTGDINGWSMNTSGGTIGGSMTGQNDKKGGYFEGDPSVSVGGALELNNNGEGAAVEAWKEIPAQKKGLLQWDFQINATRLNTKTGDSIKVMNRETGKDIIKLVLEENQLKYTDAKNDKIAITGIQNSTWTTFRMLINCDAGTFTLIGYDTAGIQKELATDVPFINKAVPTLLYLGTDGSQKLAMGYNGWFYKLNETYENFYLQKTGIAPNFFQSHNTVLTSNGPRVKLSASLVFAKMDDLSTTDQASLSKTFKTTSNVVDTLVQVEFAQKKDHARILLDKGSETAIEIFTKGEDLCYFDNKGNTQVLLKKYTAGVQYTFKIRTYLEMGKAELSVNGSKASGLSLPVGITDIDTVKIETGVEEKQQLYVGYIRVMDYQPTTVPHIDSANTAKTTEDTYIGVNWWDNDSAACDLFYNHSRVFNRESVLGYTDNYNKDSINWQIKFAAENGIDFAAHFIVINQDYNQYDTWVDLADYNDEVKFAVTLATDAITLNENAGVSFTRDDIVKRYLPYIRERYIRSSNYLTYQNKAVIFVYFGGSIPSWWDESVKAEFDKSMQEIGLDGATLIAISNCTAYNATKAAGFDMVAEYWGMVSEEIINKTYKKAQDAGLDFIAGVGGGADARMWGTGQYVFNPLNYLTPSQFYNNCVAAKKVMGKYDKDSLASKMLFAENWGEYGEGHSIAPFGDVGFGYLNQIRRVFTDADENHKNTSPEAKYDAMFPVGWKTEELINHDMENGPANWEGTSGAGIESIVSDEFMYDANALKVTRNTSKGAIAQDVTNEVLRNGKNANYNISAYIKCFKPENVTPPLDDVRELIFIPAGDPSQAIGLTENGGLLKYVTYDPGNPSDTVKWTVRKISGNYFTIQNVATGKYITASTSPSSWQSSGYGWYKLTLEDALPETDTQTQKFYISDSLADGGAAIEASLPGGNVITNANNVANNWLVVPGQTMEWAVTNIRTNSQKYSVEFTDNNDAAHTPKKYRTHASVSLEITDSLGTHSYTFNGIARSEASYQLMGSIPSVNWTGSLQSAKFVVNADRDSADPFYVDFSHLFYIPDPNVKSINSILTGGYGNGTDNGSDSDDLKTKDPVINKILDSNGKDIVITLMTPGYINSDILKAARIAGTSVIFNYIDISGKLWYSWKFDGKTNMDTDRAVNTKISYTSKYAAQIDRITKNKNNFFLSFTNQAAFPGKTTVGLFMNDKFHDGDLLTLYSYDTNTGKVTLVSKGHQVREGFVALTLTTGKEYFLNKSGAISNENINVSPNTGEKAVPVAVTLLFIIAAGVIFLQLRRRGSLNFRR